MNIVLEVNIPRNGLTLVSLNCLPTCSSVALAWLAISDTAIIALAITGEAADTGAFFSLLAGFCYGH
jgi:hypothetical protein